jgi:SAM-dependent methyltransferase
VLGLGGGLTSNLLVAKGYYVEGVELDERIINVARDYFFLDKNIESFCDDARHFINLCNKEYEVILIDVFKAEEQPVHVITSESLSKLKHMLKPKGQLIINWHGYLAGERGLGTSVLLNTLKRNGFNYKLCSKSNNEDQRNIVVFASTSEITSMQFEINEAVIPTDLLNSDARPLLEKYNVLANQSWRKNYLQYYYSGN